jgi:hypothetical protein
VGVIKNSHLHPKILGSDLDRPAGEKIYSNPHPSGCETCIAIHNGDKIVIFGMFLP